MVDPLPAGEVRIDVRVAVGKYVAIPAAWGKYVPERAWELDPSDRRAVGDVVDSIWTVLRLDGVSDPAVWQLRVMPAAPSKDRTPQPDEPWVEAATPGALQDRVRRLAPLRGGRIVARHVKGPTTAIGITAATRGDTIRVRAKDLGAPSAKATSWQRNWTFPASAIDARSIWGGVEEGLAALSPGPSGREIALRLETAAAEHGAASGDYWFFLGFLIATPVVAILSLISADPDATGWFGIVGRAATRADLGAAALAWTALASSVLVCGAAAFATKSIADQLRLRFVVVEYAQVIGAAVASLLYFAAIVWAGFNAPIAIAAPLLFGLGALLMPSVGRWLRPN